MTETDAPRTPLMASKIARGAFTSPSPRSASHLTPPPSVQVLKLAPALHDERMSEETTNEVRSLPPISTAAPSLGSGPPPRRIPSVHEARELSEPALRDLVEELLPAFGEARMALAHTQLQLNLLSIESEEAAQRAEVEHDLTRREVQVLQAGSPILKDRARLMTDVRSPVGQLQRHLDLSTQSNRELNAENAQLRLRLKQAKKLIRQLDGRNIQLAEDNELLRDRVRQNREQSHAARTAAMTPVRQAAQAPVTPSAARHRPRALQTSAPSSQNPLDALLMADQILSGDPNNGSSTPSSLRAIKGAAGHTRGSQSMSSLPSTPPRRSQPFESPEAFRTPANRQPSIAQLIQSAPPVHKTEMRERLREDRDGTISASDDEARTDDEAATSRASQAASNMLRRHPGAAIAAPPRMRTTAAKPPSATAATSTPGASFLAINTLIDYARSSPDPTAALTPLVEAKNGRKRARTERSKGERAGLGIGMAGTPRQ